MLVSTGALFTYFDAVSRDHLIATVRVFVASTKNGATLISQTLANAAKRRTQSHVPAKAAKIAVFALRLNIASLEALNDGHEAAESLVSEP